jgi:ELWxxDGT repeat protein
MATWFQRSFWKNGGRNPSPRCRNRKPSWRSVLRTEALEDRLLPSLSPTLLLDINSVAGASSSPKFFTQVNNLVFFSADDGAHGGELWESNGSAPGTFLVKDINSSAGSSNPEYLTNVNGTLFFRANDGAHGVELWASNGTPAGTVLVKDINLGASGSIPNRLTNVNGTLFFSADDGTHGFELWESNGSAAGTFLVKDILPGAGNSYPFYPTNVNGTLFFQANDGTHGAELWQSNGSAAGTFLVQDILPGAGNSYPQRLTNVNGTVFFSADDGTHGQELWESNGSAAGTFLVQDINPGAGTSFPLSLTNVNGTLFFQANDGTHGAEVWESNGTAPGTLLVKDINPGTSGSYPGSLTNVNGTLFFFTSDGTHGAELWASNGSAAGTLLVKDINPGTSGSYPGSLTNVNGTLFFSASDGTHGAELWESNGSAAGTFLIQDINPGAASSSPQYPINVNGGLFFSADDGTHGREPWILGKGNTATSLGSFPGVSVFGQPVAFIAFVAPVAPGAGTPSGSVTFKEGSTTLAANVSLSGGHAGFSTTSLSLGSHTITAIYNGNANFLTSNSSSAQMVNQAGTTTTLSSSVNSPVSGQRVVFTASVSPLAPSIGTPTGNVDFKEGATDLTPGGVTLVGGRATFTSSSLSVGTHTLTASYGGDVHFTLSQGSNSAAPLVVNKAVSRTVLTAFPNPAGFGQVVSFTVGVSVLLPGTGTPAGTVTFTDGATTIGSMTLNGAGRATFTTSLLSRGNHAINASYGGNGNFLASAYTNFGETVQKDATTTTVTASANPAVVGTTVTFTAAVQASSPGAGTPTGTVTFTDITTVLGTGTLNGAGQATFSTSALAVGTHAIMATYAGDNNFTSSFSPNIAEVIKASTTAIAAARLASTVGFTTTPAGASLSPATVLLSGPAASGPLPVSAVRPAVIPARATGALGNLLPPGLDAASVERFFTGASRTRKDVARLGGRSKGLGPIEGALVDRL